MTNMSDRKKGMRKGGNLRQKSQKPMRNRSMISHPPQLGNYLIKHSVRLRFIASAAFSTAITFANLLDSILIATGATVGSDLFHRVRVRGVEMWSIAALGTQSSVSCQFVGATSPSFGDGKYHTDTSMGIEPAHVLARPDRLSLADLWQVSGTQTAFLIEGDAGCVIDVLLSFQQLNNVNVAVTNALVGATPGLLYWRGLDGIAKATSNFIPPSNLETI
jgi:hypothetical protein